MTGGRCTCARGNSSSWPPLHATPVGHSRELESIALAWHSEDEIGPRTVDVHVHWLRAKIEFKPRQPTYLVTVRGFGYRLDPPPRREVEGAS